MHRLKRSLTFAYSAGILVLIEFIPQLQGAALAGCPACLD
jgi:hypothetical protein